MNHDNLTPRTGAFALPARAGELTALAVSSIRPARRGQLIPHSAVRTPHSR